MQNQVKIELNQKIVWNLTKKQLGEQLSVIPYRLSVRSY